MWPSTPDLEVWGSSLTRCVVSLDKELYSTLSLFTQLYKWVLTTYCLGVTLRWTSILSTGSSNTPRHASCEGNRDKLQSFKPLARVRLYLLLCMLRSFCVSQICGNLWQSVAIYDWMVGMQLLVPISFRCTTTILVFHYKRADCLCILDCFLNFWEAEWVHESWT